MLRYTQIQNLRTIQTFIRTQRWYSQEKAFQIELPKNSFEGYNIDTPSLQVEITKTEAEDIFYQMNVIRRMELGADGLYKSKFIRGFCHLCTGQEAVPAGIEAALTREDAIITAYRCHGFTYTRGGSVGSILAELLGRKDGIAKGKGGSMHMFAPNFYGGNGIVGAQVPLGAGIAFSQKYLKKNAVTVALYGDGAANQGQVFESYNIAKLWNLPCIFICENNKYGMGTSASRASANTEYFKRCEYIPGLKVNGMDILAVKQSIKFAKDYSLNENSPVLMEISTYRYGGHSMSDPGTTYRTREEIQHMRSTNDPITGFKKRLLDHQILSEDEIKSLEKKAKKEVDQAIEFAKNSPEPEVKELINEIYIKGTEPTSFVRGRESQELYQI